MRRRELKIGVKVRVKPESEKMLKASGAWNDKMAKYSGKTGEIITVLSKTSCFGTDAAVMFDDGENWFYPIRGLELVKDKVKAPSTFEVGQYFKYEGDYFILSQVENFMICMVKLETGNRYSEPIYTGKAAGITTVQMNEICCGVFSEFEFVCKSFKEFKEILKAE